MTKRFRGGFTLIELLIVVAIIGILAAIAVPNFLNAQIRAKVSRATADMKTIESAFEMYRIDWNAYPPAAQPRVPGWYDAWCPNEVRFYRMTTPVAYLSSIPRDPFTSKSSESWEQWGWAYDYVNSYSDANHNAAWGHLWRLNSWGPDQINGWGGERDGKCVNGYPDFLYQSTNGLTSKGDIVWVGPKDPLTTNFCNIINGV
jgi:type II secretion system protein G